MLLINPKEISTAKIHAYMLSAIAPRPIAFASTLDRHGKPNLAPFSFFNAFGSHPPVVVFSPSRSVRTNKTKHTLQNIHETKEVVINVVNYDMVQQTSLASCEYPKGVNEFEKAGFTPVASQMVKPFRVKESPVQMECKVLQIIETGYEGGAANLIVCEIILMHINEDILTEEGRIDQNKLDLVARMGGAYYCRASGSALFEVPKPNEKLGIGVDNIPPRIRLSKILTGNDLGKLGNIETLPPKEEVEAYKNEEAVSAILHSSETKENQQQMLHRLAQQLLAQNQVAEAWKALLTGE